MMTASFSIKRFKCSPDPAEPNLFLLKPDSTTYPIVAQIIIQRPLLSSEAVKVTTQGMGFAYPLLLVGH